MFRRLFLDHFQNMTNAPFKNAISQIQSLRQMPVKSLLAYHKRASGFLIAAGGKDISSTGVPQPVEPLVRSILDLTIDHYVMG